jgi:hypothetical protein
MKNVTLKLDETVLTRARHAAVDERKSVSAWMADLIAHELNTRDSYERDRQGALAALKTGFALGGKPLRREELHERPAIRRRAGRQSAEVGEALEAQSPEATRPRTLTTGSVAESRGR